MRADTVRFVHECRMLDYESLISRIGGLYEQFCELQAIIKANAETRTQMSRDYQSVVSELEQMKLENTSLNRQLAHLAEQNLLKTGEVFGSSCENLSKITKNPYDSVPDIDGHEITDEAPRENPKGEIINFAGDCRKNSGEQNKKERKKTDFSSLPQINRYTLDVEAMDRKYGPGRWYVMSWTKKWTLEKTSPVCYIKNTYMPNIVPYDDYRVPVSEGRI